MKTKVSTTGSNPESEIVKLAKKGSLAIVGEREVKESHRLGLSVTILEDGKIYRVSPAGKRRFVKAITRAKKTYTTGKVFIN